MGRSQRQVMSCHCAVTAWVWLRQGNHLSEKQVGETLSTPFPLWSPVTRKRLIWENHKLSMMLAPSLSVNVHSSRKLSLPPLPLDCCSVSCGSALTKMENRVYRMPLEPHCFSLLLNRLNSLCMYLIHDQMDPPSKAALRISFFDDITFFFCSNQAYSLSNSWLSRTSWVIHVLCLARQKYSAMYQF